MQDVKIKKKDYFKHRFLKLLNIVLSKNNLSNINKGYPNVAVFAFDHIGYTITVEGIYEKEELQIIYEWLSKNNLIRGAALDIGAHIGNHSIFFSKIYKWVYSFEPNPLTLKLLSLNLQQFAKNTTVFPIGLSDKEGSVPFFLAKNHLNIGGAKIIYSSDTNNYNKDEIVNVKVNSLDQIDELKNVEIGLVKIDVEGAEFNVVSGGKETLTRNKPVILFEQQLNDFQNGRSKVIDYLNDLGYSFYIVKKTPKQSNTTFERISNLFIELVTGRKYEIKQCEYFKPDLYNMVIAVHS